MLDIRKIEYFLMVAETLNFSEAAKKLHISHQALSKQIRVLEDEVGAKLLERSTATMILTEVGKKMYDIFEPTIQHYQRSTEEILDFVELKKSTLRIGYFSGLSYGRVVAPILNYLSISAPDVVVKLVSADIDHMHSLKTLLIRDELDLVITVMPFEKDWSEVEYQRVVDDEQKIIVSDKHEWFYQNTVTKEEMAEQDMLVYAVEEYEQEMPFASQIPVRRRVPVNTVDVYMAMVESGSVFGLVSERYSRREGNFRLLDLPKEYHVDNPVICAYKKLHPLVNVLKQLKDIDFER